VTGRAQGDQLRLMADRAAWLRKQPVEVRRAVLSDPAGAASYWKATEDSVGWAKLQLARRGRELRDAMIGRRRKR